MVGVDSFIFKQTNLCTLEPFYAKATPISGLTKKVAAHEGWNKHDLTPFSHWEINNSTSIMLSVGG